MKKQPELSLNRLRVQLPTTRNNDKEGNLVTKMTPLSSTYLPKPRTQQEIKFNETFDALLPNTPWKKISEIEAMLKGGIDPNVTMLNGYKPLLFAVAMNNYLCTELLLKYGANPNIFGIIPTQSDLTVYTPLQLAVYSNQQLTELLLKSGADINFLPPTNTLYHPKNASLSKMLIDSGLPTTKIAGYKVPDRSVQHLGRVVNPNSPAPYAFQQAELTPDERYHLAETQQHSLHRLESCLLSILMQSNKIGPNVEEKISHIHGHLLHLVNGSVTLNDIFKKAIRLNKFQFCRALIRTGFDPILEEIDSANPINEGRLDEIRKYRLQNLQDKLESILDDFDGIDHGVTAQILQAYEELVNFDFGNGGYSIISDIFIKSLKKRQYEFNRILVSAGFNINSNYYKLDLYFLDCLSNADYEMIQFLYSIQYYPDRIFNQIIYLLRGLFEKNEKYFQLAIFIVRNTDNLPTLQEKDFALLGNTMLDVLLEQNSWGPERKKYLKFALDIGGSYNLSNKDYIKNFPIEIQDLLLSKFNSNLTELAVKIAEKTCDQLSSKLYNTLKTKNKLNNLVDIVYEALLQSNMLVLLINDNMNEKVRYEQSLLVVSLKNTLDSIISKISFFDPDTGFLATDKIMRYLNETILDYRSKIQTTAASLTARNTHQKNKVQQFEKFSFRQEEQNQLLREQVKLSEKHEEAQSRRVQEQLQLDEERERIRRKHEEELIHIQIQKMQLDEKSENNRRDHEEELIRLQQKLVELEEEHARRDNTRDWHVFGRHF